MRIDPSSSQSLLAYLGPWTFACNLLAPRHHGRFLAGTIMFVFNNATHSRIASNVHSNNFSDKMRRLPVDHGSGHLDRRLLPAACQTIGSFPLQ
ncbi:hypothetical protein NEOLEDRAFT_1138038 [Neolentinus lepideus HHB14362 ss-1]|uniref:Uncharacterized protein n=1 Tax=Neolentinus lepideus HHB14362 ss-1 TaxID=1314782 RepID=A0A165QFM5_9AGAM|nr:hypothetical protein NEOLEDRAFT_1138038 [Neolentinus lepideus HHB14362 ss-1]